MANLLKESLFVVGTLSGLGAAGGFAVLPFRKALRFAPLATPVAGLLSVVLGIATLYSLTDRDFVFCASVSAGLCLAATAIALVLVRPKFRWRTWVWPTIATLAVVPLVTYMADATTVRLGKPGFLYIDGTDHLGYAQMADWLRAHPVDTPPRSTPLVPYEAFPAVLFRHDPRFGSFFSLSLISAIRGLSGTFAYDIACAVILAAGILGVAGAFSRSVWSCLLLIAGLLTCHWYDYGCGGYFGKLLAYPAGLFVAGLFLSKADLRSPVVLFSLILLTAATAVMHSGTVTAFFLGMLLFGQIGCQVAFARDKDWRGRIADVATPAFAALMLIVVAVVATGTPAKPLKLDYPDWSLKWEYILPRILDLENQGVSLTSLDKTILLEMTAGAIAIWIAFIVIAIKRRDSVAGGMLIGPFVVFFVFLAGGGRAAAFQMIGTFYPFLMCAAALMIDGPRRVNLDGSRSAEGPITAEAGRPGALALGDQRNPGASPARGVVSLIGLSLLALLALGLRIPRYIGALQRYAGSKTPATLEFSQPDAERLATRIGSHIVEVDLTEPQRAIFLLVELGRRDDVHFQWTPRSWEATVGYANWPVPSYPAATLRLVPAGRDDGLPVVFRSRQYQVLDCSGLVRSTP